MIEPELVASKGLLMDNDVAIERVKRFGRQSLWLIALNIGVIACVFLWCLVAYWKFEGGDPIGSAFAYGLYCLAGIVLGALVYLPVAGAGAVLALRGLIGSSRLPDRPAFRSCVVGLVIHAGPPLIVSGVMVVGSVLGYN